MAVRSGNGLPGRCLAVLLLALSLPALAQAQSAGDVRRARTLFEDGTRLFEREKYDEALAAFQESWVLNPRSSTLYHLGTTQRMMSDIATARGTLEQFLAETADGSEAGLRADAQRQLDEMNALPCDLTIVVDRPDALVFVDTIVRGVAPLAYPVQINGGEHVVRAQLEGFEEARQTVTLRGGEPVTVTLTMTPTAVVGPVEPVEPLEPVGPVVGPVEPVGPVGGGEESPGGEGGGMSPWFWALVGLGGATGIAAIGTGAASLVAVDDYKAAGASDWGEHDRIVTMELVTDVMIGVTAGAAVAALLVGLLVDGAEPAEEAPAGTPTATLGPAGMVLRW